MPLNKNPSEAFNTAEGSFESISKKLFFRVTFIEFVNTTGSIN